MLRVLSKAIELASASGLFIAGCLMIDHTSLRAAAVALIMFGSMQLYTALSDLVGIRSHVAAGEAGYGAPVAAQKALSRPPDAIWRSSVHEAGHFLAIALLPARPKYLYARVQTTYNGGDKGGEISFHMHSEIDTPDMLEGQMLVMLAGQIAEQLIFGQPSISSRTDDASWEDSARKLIAAEKANGADHPWFFAPANEFEAHINARSLVRLRNKHIEQITAFLQAREDKLIDAAARLRKEHAIESDDAFELLETLLPGELGWQTAA